MNNLGQDAEHQAQQFLMAQGLILRDNNFACKAGEIDIIAKHNNTLVFIEVRLRKHTRFGQAYETVTKSKQRKIIKTALFYLQKKQLFEKHPCRFDIVALDRHSEPLWIQDAFQAYY